MRPPTQELLAGLKATRWFRSVGQPLANCKLATVDSWEAALNDDGTDKWGEVRLLAANQLRHAVRTADESRLSEWNAIAAELRPLVHDLAKAKVTESLKELAFCGILTDLASWDILHSAMAADFSHLVVGGFYIEL